MVSAVKIYSNIKTKNTYFEVWGGSTKHPDVRRVLQWDKEGDRFISPYLIPTVEYECFQWLVQCISELDWGTFNLLSKLMEMAKYSFEESTIF